MGSHLVHMASFRMPNQVVDLVGEASDYNKTKTSRRLALFLF